MSEAGHTPTRAVVLDPQAIATLGDLVGSDPEAMAEIVDAFLEDAPDRLSEIQTGLASGDSELVRRAAHTLKANGLTFGAEAFASVCAALEQTSKLGTLDGGKVLATEVERTWAEARPAIEALRT